MKLTQGGCGACSLNHVSSLNMSFAPRRKDIDGQDQLETQTGNQMAGVMDSAVVDLHRQASDLQCICLFASCIMIM